MVLNIAVLISATSLIENDYNKNKQNVGNQGQEGGGKK